MGSVLKDLKAIETGLSIPMCEPLRLLETCIEEEKDRRLGLSRVYVLRAQLGVQFCCTDREEPLAIERAESYIRHLIYGDVESIAKEIMHHAYNHDANGVIKSVERLLNFIKGDSL